MAKPGDVVYSEEIHRRICDLVAEGSNLTQICQMPDMPNVGTVYRWLREGCPDSKPGLRDDYARAREQRADSRADRIDAICGDVQSGNLAPDAARVIIDALKWQAGKEAPRYYGDRTKTEVEGSLTINVNTGVERTPDEPLPPASDTSKLE